MIVGSLTIIHFGYDITHVRIWEHITLFKIPQWKAVQSLIPKTSLEDQINVEKDVFDASLASLGLSLKATIGPIEA